LLLIIDSVFVKRQLRELILIEVLGIFKNIFDNIAELDKDSSITKSVIHSINNCHHISNHNLIFSNNRLLCYFASAGYDASMHRAGKRGKSVFQSD